MRRFMPDLFALLIVLAVAIASVLSVSGGSGISKAKGLAFTRSQNMPPKRWARAWPSVGVSCGLGSGFLSLIVKDVAFRGGKAEPDRRPFCQMALPWQRCGDLGAVCQRNPNDGFIAQ